MLVPVVRFIFVLAGALIGLAVVQLSRLPETVSLYNGIIVIIGAILIGAGLGYVLGGVIGRRLIKAVDLIENGLERIPASDLVFGIIGLIVGLLVAYLISPTLQQMGLWGILLSIFLFFILGVFGVYLSLRKKKELEEVISSLGREAEEEVTTYPSPEKILDTSVIIDGRIGDIFKTGFIEGKVLLPSFVLKELQNVADSSDRLKRTRGRRGLDVLAALQKETAVDISIIEKDYLDVKDVDAKLTRLAKERGAILVTNDYNLNKVARLRGVKVLNINDLANAVKPVVLPGEEMLVTIIKEGREREQGVGYLDDGTMVVVEEGKRRIGQKLDVVVTSVLQTPAGKMIFTKPK